MVSFEQHTRENKKSYRAFSWSLEEMFYIVHMGFRMEVHNSSTILVHSPTNLKYTLELRNNVTNTFMSTTHLDSFEIIWITSMNQ